MHRSWDVCIEGEEGSCNTGRFRDGCSQSDEEGYGEEHVLEETLEVETAYLFYLLYLSPSPPVEVIDHITFLTALRLYLFQPINLSNLFI